MSVLVVSTRAELGQLTAAQAATYGKMGVLSSTIAEAWYWDASSTAAADTSTVIMPADSPATGRILACDTDYEGMALLLMALKDGTAEISSSVSQTSSALDTLTGGIVDALAYLTDTSTFAELEELVALQALEQNFTSYTLYKQSTTAMYASLSKATASIKQVSTVAVSATEAVADITTTVQANYAETVALVTQEVQARANADLSLSTTLTNLTSTVSGNTALITQEAQTRATADETLSTLYNSLSSTVSGNTASITQEAQTRASADSALSTTLTSLTSTVSGNTALITQEAQTRATADETLSTLYNSLSSTVSTNTATITQEAQTRASADSAISDSLTKVTATVGNISASGYMRSWVVTSSEGASATVGFGAVASSGATSATAALLLHAESNGTTWAAVKVGHFFFLNANDEAVAWFDDSGNLNLAGMLTTGAISDSANIGIASSSISLTSTTLTSGDTSAIGLTPNVASEIYRFSRDSTTHPLQVQLSTNAYCVAPSADSGVLTVQLEYSSDGTAWIFLTKAFLQAGGTTKASAGSMVTMGIIPAGYKYYRIAAIFTVAGTLTSASSGIYSIRGYRQALYF